MIFEKAGVRSQKNQKVHPIETTERDNVFSLFFFYRIKATERLGAFAPMQPRWGSGIEWRVWDGQMAKNRVKRPMN
jgi:hypothetical protein